jgi:hypothetical protein
MRVLLNRIYKSEDQYKPYNKSVERDLFMQSRI